MVEDSNLHNKASQTTDNLYHLWLLKPNKLLQEFKLLDGNHLSCWIPSDMLFSNLTLNFELPGGSSLKHQVPAGINKVLHCCFNEFVPGGSCCLFLQWLIDECSEATTCRSLPCLPILGQSYKLISVLCKDTSLMSNLLLRGRHVLLAPLMPIRPFLCDDANLDRVVWLI